MDIAHILLAVGGDSGNTVPKLFVTAAEIAVLRAIHGEASVTDVEPCGERDITGRAELQRLRGIYGRARDSDDNSIVETLFPGAAARVFETLDELELDESFYKAERRVKPAPAAEEPKKARGRKAAAAPVEEAPAPEGDDDEDDGITDMKDVLA